MSHNSQEIPEPQISSMNTTQRFNVSLATAMNSLATSDSPNSNLSKCELKEEPGSAADYDAFLADKNKKPYCTDKEALAKVEKEIASLRRTQYGGGRTSAADSKKNDDKMMIVAEHFYKKKDLLLKGNSKTPEHRKKVDEFWTFIEQKLKENNYSADDIRNKFQTFNRNALNKKRQMAGTGAAAIKLTEAEKYIIEKHGEDQSVTGINCEDVGTINVVERPNRNRKASKPFTFPTPKANKKRKATTVDTPEAPASKRTTTSSRWSLASDEFRNSVRQHSTSPSQQRNYFDEEFADLPNNDFDIDNDSVLTSSSSKESVGDSAAHNSIPKPKIPRRKRRQNIYDEHSENEETAIPFDNDSLYGDEPENLSEPIAEEEDDDEDDDDDDDQFRAEDEDGSNAEAEDDQLDEEESEDDNLLYSLNDGDAEDRSRKEKAKKKKTGIDSSISLGKAPKSKNRIDIEEKILNVEESVEIATSKICEQSKIRTQNQKILTDKQAKVLDAELEIKAALKRKTEEEAEAELEIKAALKRKAEAEAETAELKREQAKLELEKLKKT
uniref:Regulatory protein zeste n=1 Tax=Panagrolaimus sp. PS1159 TaxID=55785 RepID=A0AC35GUG2_9BILA